MMTWTDQIHGGRGVGPFALWTGAGLVVVSLYAGGLVWALRQPPVSATASPPPAIMIDLAPEPEAVDTEKTEIAPDRTITQEIKREKTVEPVKQPVPEATPELEKPVEEDKSPGGSEERLNEKRIDPQKAGNPVVKPAPTEEQTTLPHDDGAVPIPMARPNPSAGRSTQKHERRSKLRRHQKPAPASRRADKAGAPVRQSHRNAARQSAGGRRSAMSVSQWQSRLLIHLMRYKRYPAGARSRGQTGTVYVLFRIDGRGRVLSVSVARSSGFAALDNAARALVRRASPVPAPPSGASRTVTAPVRFSVR